MTTTIKRKYNLMKQIETLSFEDLSELYSWLSNYYHDLLNKKSREAFRRLRI